MAGNSGSNFWADITDRQKDMRVAFHNNKMSAVGKPKAASTKKPAIPVAAASKWRADLVYQFSVEAPGLGIIKGEFRSVQGLTTDEWDFEMYREGGDNGPEHMLPTHTKAGRITLEYALKHPDPFLMWCGTLETGAMIYQPITIMLLDKKIPRAMWEIPQSIVAKIEGPDLDAMSGEIAINRVELAHNGLIRIDIPF